MKRIDKDTKRQRELQAMELRLRAKRMGITAAKIARGLRVSEAAVSTALSEPRPIAMSRISRYLDRMERVAAEKAARSADMSKNTPTQAGTN